MMKKEYLEKFFYDMGLDNISSEKKEEYLAKIIQNLEDRIFIRIKSLLSDLELSEWEKLKTDEELDKFYADHKIDISIISSEEAQIYREQLIQNLAYLNSKQK